MVRLKQNKKKKTKIINKTDMNFQGVKIEWDDGALQMKLNTYRSCTFFYKILFSLCKTYGNIVVEDIELLHDKLTSHQHILSHIGIRDAKNV